MPLGPDGADDLAERQLQRTATWPWARNSSELERHVRGPKSGRHPRRLMPMSRRKLRVEQEPPSCRIYSHPLLPQCLLQQSASAPQGSLRPMH